MAGDFLHPEIRRVFDLHFPGLRTTALGPDGEEVEVCGLCCGLERVADAPCPRCCRPCPACGQPHPTLESWEDVHGRAF
jgi:hypothetical protein